MYDEVDADSNNFIHPTGPPPRRHVRDYRSMNDRDRRPFPEVNLSIGLPTDDDNSESSQDSN